MGATVSTGIVIMQDCSLTVTDGGGPVVISLTAGQYWVSAEALLAWLDTQIEATLASTWSLSVSNADVVVIAMSSYPFSWAWGTATAVRDYLGFAADAAAQAGPWTAPSAVEGHWSITRNATTWPIDHGAEWEPLTQAMVLGDGSTETATAIGAQTRRSGAVGFMFDTQAPGDFSEIATYWDWIPLVDDGRPWTVFPYGADYGPLATGGSDEWVACQLSPDVAQIDLSPAHGASSLQWVTEFPVSVLAAWDDA